MSLELSNPEYVFNQRTNWSAYQTMLSRELIRDCLQEGVRPQAALDRLRANGVGYRKTDFLKDYGRAMAIEYARTPDRQDRANQWYNTAEHIRTNQQLPSRYAAAQFMGQWRDASFDSLDQAQAASDYEAGGWYSGF